jgi:hypothetical protein
MRIGLVIAAAALLALPGLARADSCASTCGGAKRTCQQASSTAFRTCHADAMASSASGIDRHNAFHDCRDALAQAKQTCLGALHDCLTACSTPPPPGSCRADCTSKGTDCVQGAIGAARTCVQGCATGPGRLACLFQCGQQALTALGQCKSGLHTCLAGCQASPSGAFLQ